MVHLAIQVFPRISDLLAPGYPRVHQGNKLCWRWLGGCAFFFFHVGALGWTDNLGLWPEISEEI